MKAQKMKFSVVIINWNKADQTEACLRYARTATSVPTQWIIVDNGSDHPLPKFSDDVIILYNHRNLGFAGGANRGIEFAFQCGAEHVVILNNDAEALPGSLDALFASADGDPSIGLASAVILNSDDGDKVDFHGGLRDGLNFSRTTDEAEYRRWSSIAPDRIWLVGTAMLITRRMVERAGYFDESFFAYWEDNDLSIRSTAAGFRNIVVSEACVRHASGKLLVQPEDRPAYYYYYMLRNEIFLFRKFGWLQDLKAVYYSAIRAARLYRRLDGRPLQKRAVRLGLLHGLLGRGGACPSSL